MLNCSRSIDIHSRFGIPRIAFISSVTVVITFLVSFEMFHYYSNVPFSDRHFLIFIISMLCLYPLHKLIHVLTVLPYFRYIKMYKLMPKKWFPFYNIFLDKPVRKSYFCVCLIAPLVVISILCIIIATKLPHYGHYLMFLLALNAGFSVMDILYLKVILFCKRGQYVEEHVNGFLLLEKNGKSDYMSIG
ncbi:MULTISPECIES: DUF3267 domain-containing protein [unclassified Staphylococcus]|uniref:DUF3267 domain-containing protein n=1 Tax=unclassified Staphylococcus TaxID=91994 RepID=UPI0021CE4CF1|nr:MULTISPECIES: DUF3267 domain-containing protein [unclassified Staphylococcus]UXR77686.1 DUF3267 domain-containing protein [Staphylococcus sp. IVB6227]UXR81842.1 DUF3267 domain-containing protein [Staphylococcus sp. IVB6214]